MEEDTLTYVCTSHLRVSEIIASSLWGKLPNALLASQVKTEFLIIGSVALKMTRDWVVGSIRYWPPASPSMIIVIGPPPASCKRDSD